MKEWWVKFQFGADARRNLYQSFLDYLIQGIPVNDIVTNLATSITKAKAGRFMYQVYILEDVALQMSTGIPFPDALSKWIPSNEAMSIRAGMESGDPVTGMRNTIDAVGAASEMRSVIFSKLTYPVVLIFALIGMILFFSTAIIPKIADVLDPSIWPENSRGMYTMAMFVQSYVFHMALILVGVSVLVQRSLTRLTGRLRGILDCIPPYSFYKAFHSANLLISMAALMRSGVPFASAMEQLHKHSNPFMASHLEKMSNNLAEGMELSVCMDTGLLSQEMMVSVHMMSNNANFQSAIYEIGRQAVKKGIERIALIAGMLNALAMFGVAGYVGWVYFCFNQVANAVGQAAVG